MLSLNVYETLKEKERMLYVHKAQKYWYTEHST